MRGAVYNSGIPNAISNLCDICLHARRAPSRAIVFVLCAACASDNGTCRRLEWTGTATRAQDCCGDRAWRRLL